MESPRWTVEQLAGDLCRLGVSRGDLIMVHASLRAPSGRSKAKPMVSSTRSRPRSARTAHDHPEGRMGASGRLADRLLDDAPWDDYYGADSVLHRFVDAGGRVLRLGADLDTLTVLHYAEYLVPLPAKRRVRRHRLVKGREHPELRVVECLDDCDGIVDYPDEDYFGAILRDYLSAGRAATGVVGRATSELIDAADVVDFGVAWMAEHLVAV